MPTAAPQSDAQKLHEAKKIARDHGCVVFDRVDTNGQPAYLLYRLVGMRKVLVGKRNTPSAIRSLVRKACNFH